MDRYKRDRKQCETVRELAVRCVYSLCLARQEFNSDLVTSHVTIRLNYGHCTDDMVWYCQARASKISGFNR